MTKALSQFEAFVRRVREVSHSTTESEGRFHPFDEWNIHPEIATVSLKLFDDGHYAQATFEAFKYVDKEVSAIAGLQDSGYSMMMNAFSETNPKIKLTNLANTSEVDEQKGFRFLFGGTVWAIRNPRGHEVNLKDTIDMCLDHLSVASFLLRRLEQRIAP